MPATVARFQRNDNDDDDDDDLILIILIFLTSLSQEGHSLQPNTVQGHGRVLIDRSRSQRLTCKNPGTITYLSDIQ